MARSNGGSSFWSDFRDFITKGNVVDLAVAVVLGGAFGQIIESLVADIITPAILTPALQAANVDDLESLVIPGTAIHYGLFLSAIINFLVIAFALFLVIRAYTKAQKKLERQKALEEPAGPDPIAVQQQTADALNRLTDALDARRL
ncbi:MAG: large conductance mechanosensitive channel protein MscL [Cyanobacteria bacterium J06638_22]